MRKKKKNMPIILAIVVGTLALALVLFARYWRSEVKKRSSETVSSETELKKHDVRIYKTDSASIEYEEDWLSEELKDEIHLSIREGSYVTLLVKPKKLQLLTSVDIVDVKDHFSQVQSMIRPTCRLLGMRMTRGLAGSMRLQVRTQNWIASLSFQRIQGIIADLMTVEVMQLVYIALVSIWS